MCIFKYYWGFISFFSVSLTVLTVVQNGVLAEFETRFERLLGNVCSYVYVYIHGCIYVHFFLITSMTNFFMFLFDVFYIYMYVNYTYFFLFSFSIVFNSIHQFICIWIFCHFIFILEPLMLTIRFDGQIDRETRSDLFLRFIKLTPVMDLPYVSNLCIFIRACD